MRGRGGGSGLIAGTVKPHSHHSAWCFIGCRKICVARRKIGHGLNRDVAQLVWLNRDDLWNGAKTSEWVRSQLDAVIAAEAQMAAWDEMKLPELIQPDDFSETDPDDPYCQPLGGPTTETEEEIFCTPNPSTVVRN